MRRIVKVGALAAVTVFIGAETTRADPTIPLCRAMDVDTSAALLEARRRASFARGELRYADPRSQAVGASYVGAPEKLFAALTTSDRDPTAAKVARVALYGAALAEAKRHEDVRAVWALEHSMPSDDAFVDLTPSLFPAGECRATPRGAWAFGVRDVVSTLSDAEGGRHWPLWSGVLTLNHVGLKGERVTVDLESCCGQRYDGDVANDAPTYFDYDGDGEPEVVFHGRLLLDGPTDRGPTVVLTYKEGAVIPYAPLASTPTLGAASDVDGDGRPDLLTHAGVLVLPTVPAACGIPSPEGYSPTFLLHSLPSGAFSLSDDAAKKFARTWCPAAPTTIQGARDAGCARLWATPDRLASERARVVASCVEVDTKTCRAGPVPPPKGLGCSLRTQAFDATPPLTLP